MKDKMKEKGPIMPGGGGDAPPNAGVDGLGKAKKGLDQLLKAGDDAIKKALSSNSQDFLAANRQQGGE